MSSTCYHEPKRSRPKLLLGIPAAYTSWLRKLPNIPRIHQDPKRNPNSCKAFSHPRLEHHAWIPSTPRSNNLGKWRDWTPSRGELWITRVHFPLNSTKTLGLAWRFQTHLKAPSYSFQPRKAALMETQTPGWTLLGREQSFHRHFCGWMRRVLRQAQLLQNLLLLVPLVLGWFRCFWWLVPWLWCRSHGV